MEIQKFRDAVALNDRLRELIEVEKILENHNTLTITYVNGEGKYFHLDDSKTKAIQTILCEHYRAIKEDVKKAKYEIEEKIEAL
jgi:hypothetical protein